VVGGATKKPLVKKFIEHPGAVNLLLQAAEIVSSNRTFVEHVFGMSGLKGYKWGNEQRRWPSLSHGGHGAHDRHHDVVIHEWIMKHI